MWRSGCIGISWFVVGGSNLPVDVGMYLFLFVGFVRWVTEWVWCLFRPRLYFISTYKICCSIRPMSSCFSSWDLSARMLSALNVDRASHWPMYRSVAMRRVRARLPISFRSAGVFRFIAFAESLGVAKLRLLKGKVLFGIHVLFGFSSSRMRSRTAYCSAASSTSASRRRPF